MFSKMSPYKSCFILECYSSTKNNPTKIFITLPRNLIRRKKWFIAARRKFEDFSPKSVWYCCEDHFNLEQDMENYLEYRFSKVAARMKPDVVPHIFTLCRPAEDQIKPCQNDEKKARKWKIKEILLQNETSSKEDVEKDALSNPQPSSSGGVATNQRTTSGFTYQANPLYYRSKAIQVALPKIEPKFEFVEPLSSKQLAISDQVPKKTVCMRSDSGNSVKKESSDSDVRNESGSSDTSESLTVNDTNCKQLQMRTLFIKSVEEQLRMYTGIPNENKKIIEILEKRGLLKQYFIYLALYKIRTNDSFEKIGELFNFTKSYASEIFQRSIIILSKFMKELIFWPSKQSIKQNLPNQFRNNFLNVQSIIDCLEIKIHKLNTVKEQASTWSDNKKCNTVKYLISSTPDGLINFISKGYGGGVTDLFIFEDCDYLKVLPKNSVIMADRGFKKIETLLRKKKSTLVSPPSVVNIAEMSENDVMHTKRIASGRIHIERIIKRVRDFEMLSPHATVNINPIQKLDDIIIIACAIINLQKTLIKQ